MRTLSSTKLYDLFKFTVALVLLILLILLLLQRPDPSPPASPPPTQPQAETATQPVSPASTTPPEPFPALTALPPFPGPPGTVILNLGTRELETAEGRPVYKFDDEKGDWAPIIPDELAGTLDPDPVLRSVADNWVIETKEGQLAYLWDMDNMTWKEVVPEAEEMESEPTVTTEIDCPLAKPSRLAAGIKGRVMVPLNIRSSPGIANNRLFTMSPGTELKIQGNPTCLPYHKGAYLWWQVEIVGGQVGWSAEAPQNEEYYFIDPVE